jgi:hypothetical protein
MSSHGRKEGPLPGERVQLPSVHRKKGGKPRNKPDADLLPVTAWTPPSTFLQESCVRSGFSGFYGDVLLEYRVVEE